MRERRETNRRRGKIGTELGKKGGRIKEVGFYLFPGR